MNEEKEELEREIKNEIHRNSHSESVSDPDSRNGYPLPRTPERDPAADFAAGQEEASKAMSEGIFRNTAGDTSRAMSGTMLRNGSGDTSRAVSGTMLRNGSEDTDGTVPETMFGNASGETTRQKARLREEKRQKAEPTAADRRQPKTAAADPQETEQKEKIPQEAGQEKINWQEIKQERANRQKNDWEEDLEQMAEDALPAQYKNWVTGFETILEETMDVAMAAAKEKPRIETLRTETSAPQKREKIEVAFPGRLSRGSSRTEGRSWRSVQEDASARPSSSEPERSGWDGPQRKNGRSSPQSSERVPGGSRSQNYGGGRDENAAPAFDRGESRRHTQSPGREAGKNSAQSSERVPGRNSGRRADSASGTSSEKKQRETVQRGGSGGAAHKGGGGKRHGIHWDYVAIWILVLLLILICVGVLIFLLPEEYREVSRRQAETQAGIETETETETETEAETESEYVNVVPQPDIDVQLLTINEWSRPGEQVDAIEKIVIHYLGNPKTTAQENHDYFESLKDLQDTYMSANFIVGLEGEIIECVPPGEIAYASNSMNHLSVSIENCHLDESGRFTQETYDSLVKLTAWLVEEYGLEREDIIRHYDVTGKECPIYYVKNEDKWEAFRDQVMEYIEECHAQAEGESQ